MMSKLHVQMYWVKVVTNQVDPSVPIQKSFQVDLADPLKQNLNVLSKVLFHQKVLLLVCGMILIQRLLSVVTSGLKPC